MNKARIMDINDPNHPMHNQRIIQKYPILRYQLLHDNPFKPQRGTAQASGIDVFSPVDVVIPKRGDALIPLNLKFDIPYGWDLTVNNKSGVATKKKLDKGAELIDGDYTGNCHAHLFNNSDVDVVISRGDKIVQLVMREVWLGDLEQTDDITKQTNRGENGFGSTGSNYANS